MAGTRFAGMFEPMQLRSGAVGSNAGSAADAVSVGKIMGDIRATSVKHDEIAARGMQTRSDERNAVMDAAARVEAEDIRSKAAVDIAKEERAASKPSGLSTLGSVAGIAARFIPGIG